MNENLKEWIIGHEYEIPRKLFHLAWKVPHVTWLEATKLYQLSVEETKIYFNVKHICDIPWGKGLYMAKQSFENKLLSLEAKRVKEEENYI